VAPSEREDRFSLGCCGPDHAGPSDRGNGALPRGASPEMASRPGARASSDRKTGALVREVRAPAGGSWCLIAVVLTGVLRGRVQEGQGKAPGPNRHVIDPSCPRSPAGSRTFGSWGIIPAVRELREAPPGSSAPGLLRSVPGGVEPAEPGGGRGGAGPAPARSPQGGARLAGVRRNIHERANPQHPHATP